MDDAASNMRQALIQDAPVGVPGLTATSDGLDAGPVRHGPVRYKYSANDLIMRVRQMEKMTGGELPLPPGVDPDSVGPGGYFSPPHRMARDSSHESSVLIT